MSKKRANDAINHTYTIRTGTNAPKVLYMYCSIFVLITMASFPFV